MLDRPFPKASLILLGWRVGQKVFIKEYIVDQKFVDSEQGAVIWKVKSVGRSQGIERTQQGK